MTAIIQGLNANIGLLGFLFTLIVAIIAGKASTKSQINSNANDAQQRTIDAMKTQLDMQRDMINDMKIENERLKLLQETITVMMKTMGFVIVIDGKMISVKNNGITTTKMQENE